MDFYFADKADANKFVETVLQLIPSRKKKESKTLKGSDVRNNTYRFEVRADQGALACLERNSEGLDLTASRAV